MTSSASRDRSQSSSSTTFSNVTRQSAAFQGASHAFSLAPTSTKLPHNTYNGTNGALAAASIAGRRRQQEQNISDVSLYSQKRDMSSIKNSRYSGASETHKTIRQSPQSREQSPSHAAALLATSKSTPTREPALPSTPSPLQHVDNALDWLPADRNADETSIGATNVLINLFESKKPLQSATPLTHSVRYVTKPALAIASPTPVRPQARSKSSRIGSLQTFAPGAESESVGSMSSHNSYVGTAVEPADAARAVVAKPVPSDPSLRKVPDPPAPRRTGKRPPLDGSEDGGKVVSARRSRSNFSSSIQASASQSTELFLSDTSAALRSRLGKPESDAFPLSIRRPISTTVPSHLSSTLSPRPPMPSSRSYDHPKSSQEPVKAGRRLTRSSDTYVPHLTVDSLANAMVASSLASSRAPSPTKPALPPPRRHAKPHYLFHHHHNQDQNSRTPSPAKGMRHTMREHIKSDSEEEYKKKHGHFRKHSNKHHEGDRKRYRNQVTELERKRYEGVWAANRGLLMPTEIANAGGTVLNVVVRDVWRRSRLPDDVLEEVWDLVDSQGVGRLERDEFVVGMWLIDQRLKGNKLPHKVSESVWSSVRRLTGIKVPRNRR
ncbi:Increased rDNA silencing protein [Mycoblastus sanguinarius]|nr:Increased rDNA silencing protein [Mycoblastus sanguinarius]